MRIRLNIVRRSQKQSGSLYMIFIRNGPLHLVLALLLVAGAAFLTGCTQTNSESESPSGELANVYLAYLEGIKARDLELVRTLSAAKRQGWIHLMEKMPPDKREQAWQTMAELSTEGKDIRVAKEVIEEDRGILRAEWFGQPFVEIDVDRMVFPSESLDKVERKQIETRNYMTVFFVKERGSWKYLKSSQVSYHDPRPLFEFVDKKNDYLLNPQHHCAFSPSAAMCSDTTHNDDACWACFAKLNADPALCDYLGHELEVQDSAFFHNHIAFMRGNCKIELVDLMGDTRVCANLPDKEILGINPQQRCLDRIKNVGFLPSTNIYTLDSDGDGLTDMREIYFNTSIASPDTDNDGQSDFDEVTAMSNPLGTGKLGDHLK